MSNIHKVKKGMAEALELTVDEAMSGLKGKCISDLDLTGDITIPCIQREEEVLMAHGTTEINAGDHLIVFYKSKEDLDIFYNKAR